MPKRKRWLQLFVFEKGEAPGKMPGRIGPFSSDAPPRQMRPAGEVSTHKKRVVIVDDDELVRTIFQKILKMNDFEVLASLSDGQELVSALDKMNPKPEAILLDERMPRMSGIEASKMIHSKYPAISIIFVSADDSAKERAKEAGARIFVSKPITAHDLIRALSVG
jgi:DNA-binding NarL/FixJ family response regulator